MIYVEAFSKEYRSEYTYKSIKPFPMVLFLGGGISNCIDWQSEVVEELSYQDDDLVVINPRRSNFDIFNTADAIKQIEWEHRHIAIANYMFFWFPYETLCPITLFEYGKCLALKKPIFVGCHPDYTRRLDLEVQTRLEDSELEIRYSLADMVLDVNYELSHPLG